MGDFMRDHIGRREIPAGPKLSGHGRKERCVQIGFAVCGTIKRACRPGCTATGALRDTRKKHQRWGTVFPVQLRAEDTCPDLFGGGQNRTGKCRRLFICRGHTAPLLLGYRTAAALQQGRHVNAREVPDRQKHQQPNAANTTRGTPAPAT